MNTTAPSCIKCLASFEIALHNQGVDLILLREFVQDHVALSHQHYDVARVTMSIHQRMEYLAKQQTAQLFLSLLERHPIYSRS